MRVLLIIFALFTLAEQRRGGGGIGIGRGGGGGGRGRSGGGGIFGGGRQSAPVNRGVSGGSGGFQHKNSRPAGSGGHHQSTGGGGGGGIGGWFGNKGSSGAHHQPKFRPQTSTYKSGSGIGSMVRSNGFKNAIVGAAAGYLTYQAGKAIIRSVVAPMMWNNRPYYWGMDHYRPGGYMGGGGGGGYMGGGGYHQNNEMVCRMPIEPNDPQFGNVYFQDNTRPREIVWSCSYNEHCCGYECCPGGNGGGFGGSGGYHHGSYWGAGSSPSLAGPLLILMTYVVLRRAVV